MKSLLIEQKTHKKLYELKELFELRSFNAVILRLIEEYYKSMEEKQ